MRKPNAYEVFTKAKDEHIEHHQPKLFCLLEKKPIYIGMDRGRILTFGMIIPENNNWHNLSLFLREDTYFSSR